MRNEALCPEARQGGGDEERRRGRSTGRCGENVGERRAWRACLVEGRPVCPGHRGRGRLEVGAWNGEAVPAGAVFTGKKLRPGEDGWDGAAAETACGSGNGDVPGRFFCPRDGRCPCGGSARKRGGEQKTLSGKWVRETDRSAGKGRTATRVPKDEGKGGTLLRVVWPGRFMKEKVRGAIEAGFFREACFSEGRGAHGRKRSEPAKGKKKSRNTCLQDLEWRSGWDLNPRPPA